MKKLSKEAIEQLALKMRLQAGVLESIPSEEIMNRHITTATMLRVEQLFGGEKARLLYEQERISEGHYVELLNMLK